ncbi:MAG: hypothetical protein JJ992_02435 [Planctomycetes bacterium]|nr:hypothetical protein [Planctomycetota bacterium]
MVEWLTVAPFAARQDVSFAPWRTIGEETDDLDPLGCGVFLGQFRNRDRHGGQRPIGRRLIQNDATLGRFHGRRTIVDR